MLSGVNLPRNPGTWNAVDRLPQLGRSCQRWLLFTVITLSVSSSQKRLQEVRGVYVSAGSTPPTVKHHSQSIATSGSNGSLVVGGGVGVIDSLLAFYPH